MGASLGLVRLGRGWCAGLRAPRRQQHPRSGDRRRRRQADPRGPGRRSRGAPALRRLPRGLIRRSGRRRRHPSVGRARVPGCPTRAATGPAGHDRRRGPRADSGPRRHREARARGCDPGRVGPVDLVTSEVVEHRLRLGDRLVTLLEGPAGWGEYSPLPGYPCDPARAWRAAREAAVTGWPAPRRDHVAVNALVERPGFDPAALAGYPAVKVKVGFDGDVDLVAAVRDAVGPSVALRVDANGAWDDAV